LVLFIGPAIIALARVKVQKLDAIGGKRFSACRESGNPLRQRVQFRSTSQINQEFAEFFG
jgi:hypothetical protein